MEIQAPKLIGAMDRLAQPGSTKVRSRVLVVDDNPGEARYTGFLLEDHDGGIPLETVDRMFEAYLRLGGHIGLPSSVGVGPYVSRLLARMMGGDLHHSRGDRRTEFCLTLPVERRRAAEGPTPVGRVQAAS